MRPSLVPRADVTAHARTDDRPRAIAAPDAGPAVLSAINPLQPPPRAARPEVEAAQQRLAAEHQPPSTAKAALRRGHPAKIALKYVTAPMCLVAGLWYTVQHPTKVHAALVDLPEPLPRIVKAGMEIVLIGSGTGKFCLPQRGTCASGLGRLGDDCSKSGAQDCVAGVCLVAGNNSVCSLPCAHDGDCGDTRYRCCESSAAGFDCSDAKRAGDAPKSGTGVCAPLGGLFGDDCSPGRPPCQTGTCLDLGTARLCTVPCAPGCPAGFACRKAQAVGDGAEVDICFPSGGGKAGAPCDFGPAACESGLCIRKDSGPVCTQPCTADGQCPDTWHCSVVLAVDQRSVQACLPPTLQ